MTTRRDALVALLGTTGAAWPMTGLTVGSGGAGFLAAALQAASSGSRTVQPATLERPSPAKSPPPFVPFGYSRPKTADYIEEEWFASGVDDTGHPYKTQIFLLPAARPCPLQRHHYRGTVACPRGAADLHVHRRLRHTVGTWLGVRGIAEDAARHPCEGEGSGLLCLTEY